MTLPRTMAAVSGVVGCVLLAACSGSVPLDGPRVSVLFDERHDLEGGERVRLLDFDIGRVESVELSRGRIRVGLVLEEDALESLTEGTVFVVRGSGRDRGLVGDVIEADAPSAAPGHVFEGVDSELALAILRTGHEAGSFIDRIGVSEWGRRASDFAADVEAAFSEIDWDHETEEVTRLWERASEKLQALGSRSGGELADTVETLELELRQLADELEARGHADEANRVRQRLDELFTP